MKRIFRMRLCLFSVAGEMGRGWNTGSRGSFGTEIHRNLQDCFALWGSKPWERGEKDTGASGGFFFYIIH